MNDLDMGRLGYLVLLGVVLVGWFVVHNRQSIGKLAQQAIAWTLIFLGVIAAYGLWGDIRQTVQPRQSMVSAENSINLPRAPDGHYYLTLMINDEPVNFMVDTGASQVVLTPADAEKVGINLQDLIFSGRAMTANGEVRTAPVKLDKVSLGPISDNNIRAWVNEGELDKSLLGMTYLQRWSRIEITGEGLRLTR